MPYHSTVVPMPRIIIIKKNSIGQMRENSRLARVSRYAGNTNPSARTMPTQMRHLTKIPKYNRLPHEVENLTNLRQCMIRYTLACRMLARSIFFSVARNPRTENIANPPNIEVIAFTVHNMNVSRNIFIWNLLKLAMAIIIPLQTPRE